MIYQFVCEKFAQGSKPAEYLTTYTEAGAAVA